ncbi:universal stress protein [Streptomyces caniscabiei]|uniref:universal stress protein n=1 Tax=Streptomyces caniscabiei TaxID=2746961 RepID=UPI000B2F69E8|nr:universal stress protein [Streptomyces caniscabiei]
MDGSAQSLAAAEWAAREAALRERALHPVHAWNRQPRSSEADGKAEMVRELPLVVGVDGSERAVPSFSTGRPAGEVLAEHIVASCAERARLRAPEVEVSGEAVPDDAVPALLRTATEAFALAVGERGRGELTGLLLGSVSLAVAARAVCPVVVVRGTEPLAGESHGPVVVGVGADPERTGAVRFAVREAESRGCVPLSRLSETPSHHPRTVATRTVGRAVRVARARVPSMLETAVETLPGSPDHT